MNNPNESVHKLREALKGVIRVADRKTDEFDAAHAALAATATQASAEQPAGYVRAPHYRGYANLGTGQYLLNHSRSGEVVSLVISVATDEEKAGRVVGDERANPTHVMLQPEAMAVRIDFTTVAGLDALENQLRKLRAEHFAPPSPQPVAESGAQNAAAIISILQAKVARMEEQQNGYRPDYLLNGTRFKLNFSPRGNVDVFHGYAKELQGQWVALVPASDDSHLAPAAALQPVAGLTDADIVRIWESHITPVFEMRGINPVVFARAIERHITGNAGDQKGGA